MQDEMIKQAYFQTCNCIDQFPNNPIQALQNAYAGRNLSMNLWDEKLDKTSVGCSSGCSACCHQMVVCSPFEILTIAKMALDTWPKKELDRLDDGLKLLNQLPLIAEARYGRHAPCALLKNEKCTIYEQRPMPCRAQYSNSRKQCEDCLDHGEGNIGYLLDPQIFSSALSAGINAAIKQRLQLNIEMIEFSGALLTSLLDFDRVAMEWFSGGNPFASHQIVSSQPTMDEAIGILIDRLDLV